MLGWGLGWQGQLAGARQGQPVVICKMAVGTQSRKPLCMSCQLADDMTCGDYYIMGWQAYQQSNAQSGYRKPKTQNPSLFRPSFDIEALLRVGGGGGGSIASDWPDCMPIVRLIDQSHMTNRHPPPPPPFPPLERRWFHRVCDRWRCVGGWGSQYQGKAEVLVFRPQIQHHNFLAQMAEKKLVSHLCRDGRNLVRGRKKAPGVLIWGWRGLGVLGFGFWVLVLGLPVCSDRVAVTDFTVGTRKRTARAPHRDGFPKGASTPPPAPPHPPPSLPFLSVVMNEGVFVDWFISWKLPRAFGVRSSEDLQILLFE